MRSCAYLPDKGLDATGTTIDLVEGDLADDLVAVLPVMQCQWPLISECGAAVADAAGGAGNVLAELLDLLDLTGQLGGEGLLQGLQLTLLAMNPDSRILLSARIQWSWRSRRVRQ